MIYILLTNEDCFLCSIAIFAQRWRMWKSCKNLAHDRVRKPHPRIRSTVLDYTLCIAQVDLLSGYVQGELYKFKKEIFFKKLSHSALFGKMKEKRNVRISYELLLCSLTREREFIDKTVRRNILKLWKMDT